MKGSSATSAPATTLPPGSVQPSANASRRRGNQPSPTAEGGYPLAGVSDLPDPEFHAFRQDLADVALAGRVIASHYAEPVLRRLAVAAPLHSSADDESEMIAQLAGGDELWMLDNTLGWAWGYGGPERRVGYVRAEALTG